MTDVLAYGRLERVIELLDAATEIADGRGLSRDTAPQIALLMHSVNHEYRPPMPRHLLIREDD